MGRFVWACIVVDLDQDGRHLLVAAQNQSYNGTLALSLL
jgi:hypothetical protein